MRLPFTLLPLKSSNMTGNSSSWYPHDSRKSFPPAVPVGAGVQRFTSAPPALHPALLATTSHGSAGTRGSPARKPGRRQPLAHPAAPQTASGSAGVNEHCAPGRDCYTSPTGARRPISGWHSCCKGKPCVLLLLLPAACCMHPSFQVLQLALQGDAGGSALLQHAVKYWA